MERRFTAKEKIGDIVTELPQAGEIFKEYNIDFCCGGDRPLVEAIEEQNLDQDEILTRLNQALEKAEELDEDHVDWDEKSLSEIIDHIINTHHAYLQKELPRISEFVTKILRVHGANHAELSQVHKLFHTLKMELEQHLIKEEETVFPAIKDYEKNPVSSNLEKTVKIITELEEEHETAGDILKELHEITKEYTVPDDGCDTYTLTYQLLEELESDIFQHIHLENNILFPRLEKN